MKLGLSEETAEEIYFFSHHFNVLSEPKREMNKLSFEGELGRDSSASGERDHSEEWVYFKIAKLLSIPAVRGCSLCDGGSTDRWNDVLTMSSTTHR